MGAGQIFVSKSLPPGSLWETSSGSFQTLPGVCLTRTPSVIEFATQLPSAALIAAAGCTQLPPVHSAPTYALKPASTSKTRPIQGGLGCTLRPILPVCGSGPRFYPGSSHWTFYCPCGHTSVLCPSLINHAPVQSSGSWGSASFPQTSRNPTPKLWPKVGSLLLASCVLSLPSPQPPASP